MLIKKIHRKIRNKSLAAYYKHYPALCDLRDKRVHGRVLVIESDDWGSIRVPSLEVKHSLIAKGYDMDSRPFERCDTLENNRDMEELYNVLLKYKDSRDNHPVITANSLVCNPDFDRIRLSDYECYYFEPTSKTYLEYPDREQVPDLVKKGIEMGVFLPQSHGREHFNYLNWIKQLQVGNKDALAVFEYKMCGIFPKSNPSQGNELLMALRYDSVEGKKAIISSVSEGLDLFEKRFGYKSKTFVAPCYWWSTAIEEVLSDRGVKMIQTDRACSDCETGRTYYHYSGEKNKWGQFYSVRNCMFEPAISRDENEAERCLGQIESAFEKKKVAIVSSHRINFVGGIIPENRDITLRQLDWLLSKVIKKYPDVEFMTSEALYNRIYCHVQ